MSTGEKTSLPFLSSDSSSMELKADESQEEDILNETFVCLNLAQIRKKCFLCIYEVL